MFKKIAKEIQEKIESGAIKSNLNGEIVYLKKSRTPLIGDWARIYPPINEDGSMNWFNFIFGGKKNLVKLIIYLILVGMALFAFKEVFNSYELLRDLPCVQNCLNMGGY